jgi:hypothetical protein
MSSSNFNPKKVDKCWGTLYCNAIDARSVWRVFVMKKDMTEGDIVFTDFLSDISLRTPEILVSSAWQEHAPFAFWLVDKLKPKMIVELGTHNGFSYFAFCQAVKMSGLMTSAFAIDQWTGDVHAGFYGADVYEGVQRLNEDRYSDFSSLMRSTFADALPYFGDKSIDLLHIDGRHHYEDVKEDFTSWLPKLSNSSVVLFHDINVRERDFGVYRYWSELQEQYPHFSFIHGHGLGVLGTGTELPMDILRLLSPGLSDPLKSSIRSIYSRLGRAVSSGHKAADARIREAAAVSRIGELSEKLQDAQTEIAFLQREGSYASGGAVSADELAKNIIQEQTVSRADRALIEAAEQHEKLQTELNQALLGYETAEKKIAFIEENLRRATEDVARRSKEIELLREENEELLLKKRALLDELATEKGEIVNMVSVLSQEREKTADFFALLSAERQKTAELSDDISALQSERASFELQHINIMEELRRSQEEFKLRLEEMQFEHSSLLAKHDESLSVIRSLSEEKDSVANHAILMESAFSRLERQRKQSSSASAKDVKRFIKNTVRSGLFDGKWYLAKYENVGKSQIDAAYHYLNTGFYCGYNPNQYFDTNWYIREYEDVRKSGINPLLHFELYGWREGRNPSTTFNTRYYLDNNADVSLAGVNPLLHFLKYGMHEGRRPCAKEV